jgi:hypothetical protein
MKILAQTVQSRMIAWKLVIDLQNVQRSDQIYYCGIYVEVREKLSLAEI